MIIVLINIICAVVIAMIDVKFLISFEVAFIGSAFVVYSSYKAIIKKINLISVESQSDSNNFTESSDKVDCHDSTTQNLAMTADSSDFKNILDSHDLQGNSHNDEQKTTLYNNATSRNDDVSADSTDSTNADSSDDLSLNPQQIPRKERIFLGFRLSVGILRLLSYAFIVIGVIALVNNNLFFAIPFLSGVAISSVAMALYAMIKIKHSYLRYAKRHKIF